MNLTPRDIVAELDRYIIGQSEAKRAVAIALRNRYRRSLLPESAREEILPKNILMIGPTGVGKTEIARRLAKLVKAPFVKVEATKFTEVGYVGRDVESMIRDLIEAAIRDVKEERIQEVEEAAHDMATERLLDILLPPRKRQDRSPDPFSALLGMRGQEGAQRLSSTGAGQTIEVDPNGHDPDGAQGESTTEESKTWHETRAKLKEKFEAGLLDDRMVEIEVEDKGPRYLEVLSGSGTEEMGINLSDMFGHLMPNKTRKRKVTVKEAFKILKVEEAEKLIDFGEVTDEAIERVEQSGIIFLDEIDKIAGRSGGSSPDVSREGVQRDILPIVEGSTVMTKHGPVKTDHILFIAAGAFHVAKPSELIPELQGRFPIRVELDSLNAEDLVMILTEPKNALIKQYTALLSTEGVDLQFTDDAIELIASIAQQVNDETENIGARRLHTVMEHLLEELSFEAPAMDGVTVTIDRAYVQNNLSDIVADRDLSHFIL